MDTQNKLSEISLILTGGRWDDLSNEDILQSVFTQLDDANVTGTLKDGSTFFRLIFEDWLWAGLEYLRTREPEENRTFTRLFEILSDGTVYNSDIDLNARGAYKHVLLEPGQKPVSPAPLTLPAATGFRSSVIENTMIAQRCLKENITFTADPRFRIHYQSFSDRECV